MPDSNITNLQAQLTALEGQLTTVNADIQKAWTNSETLGRCNGYTGGTCHIQTATGFGSLRQSDDRCGNPTALAAGIYQAYGKWERDFIIYYSGFINTLVNTRDGLKGQIATLKKDIKDLIDQKDDESQIAIDELNAQTHSDFVKNITAWWSENSVVVIAAVVILIGLFMYFKLRK